MSCVLLVAVYKKIKEKKNKIKNNSTHPVKRLFVARRRPPARLQSVQCFTVLPALRSMRVARGREDAGPRFRAAGTIVYYVLRTLVLQYVKTPSEEGNNKNKIIS